MCASQVARVLEPFERITKALSTSKTVVLPQMVEMASELYHATISMYQGVDDPSGIAQGLAAVLLENIVKVRACPHFLERVCACVHLPSLLTIVHSATT
jgi:hypothetical protein